MSPCKSRSTKGRWPGRTVNGIAMHGDRPVIDHFPKIKIKYVERFPGLP